MRREDLLFRYSEIKDNDAFDKLISSANFCYGNDRKTNLITSTGEFDVEAMENLSGEYVDRLFSNDDISLLSSLQKNADKNLGNYFILVFDDFVATYSLQISYVTDISKLQGSLYVQLINIEDVVKIKKEDIKKSYGFEKIHEGTQEEFNDLIIKANKVFGTDKSINLKENGSNFMDELNSLIDFYNYQIIKTIDIENINVDIVNSQAYKNIGNILRLEFEDFTAIFSHQIARIDSIDAYDNSVYVKLICFEENFKPTNIHEIYSEEELKKTNIEYLTKNYLLAEKELHSNHSEHQEWEINKSKMATDSIYSEIIITFNSKDKESMISIHIDEVFLDNVTLLSTQDITMIHNIQNEIKKIIAH